MGANVVIGPGTEFLTSGREYLHSRVEGHVMTKTVVIDKSARLSGNPTLTKGLALAKITATGKYKEYDDADSDGTEEFRGFLDAEIDLRDLEGAVVDATTEMVVFGRVVEDNTSGVDAAAKVDAGDGNNGCFFLWD